MVALAEDRRWGLWRSGGIAAGEAAPAFGEGAAADRADARARGWEAFDGGDRAADTGRGMKILVDSNVLLDVFTEDRAWFAWSAQKLEWHAERNGLVVNPIIFAEASLHFSRIEELEEALPREAYERQELPWEAAFLAGRCFAEYRSGAGRGPRPCRIFTSGRTRGSVAWRC